MGTVWPPVGSGLVASGPQQHRLARGSSSRARRRLELAVALLRGRLRAVAAALARRLLLAAGWLLGAARRRQPHWRAPAITLRRWHILLGSLLTAKLLQAGFAALCSLVWGGAARRERRRLQAVMAQSTDYSEWLQAAVALDALTGGECSRKTRPRQLRQQQALTARAATLRAMRERGDVFALCAALRLDYMRHAGDTTTNSLLEASARCPVAPPPVLKYIGEVKQCLHFIAGCEDMALDDRLAFLRELRHAYGRTGLVLSGGGSLGFWHFGVVKALLEANLLPRVVSGSSAGSIGSSLVSTHTDAELQELVESFHESANLDFFAHNATGQHMRHLIRSGYIQDHEFFQGRLRRLLGDFTFLDSYQRSGRILNISVTAADTKEPARLLNYLTAPNVLIWSAVACSSAFPFLFAPQDLLAKDSRGNIVKWTDTGAAQSERRWCDGSLEEDLPMRGLSHQFNCNFFITSQCNPYVVPIVSLMSHIPRWAAKLIESEFKHRCQQLLKVWPDSRFMKLICQPWEGDINLCLPFSALPVGKSAVNFEPSEILLAMREGQKAVWAKMPAIQAACAIEVAIDAQLAAVTRQARQQARLERAVVQRAAGGRLRGSLPSWLHIPSLGMQGVESALSLEAAGLGVSPSHSAGNLAAAEGSAAAAAEGSLAHREQAGEEQAAGGEGGEGPEGEQKPASGLLPPGPAQEEGRQAPQSGRRSRLRFAEGTAGLEEDEGEGSAGGRQGGAAPAASAAAAAAPGPAKADAVQAEADAGVQATAGRLAVAVMEAAVEALPELDLEAPGTPAVHEEADEFAPGSAAAGQQLGAAGVSDSATMVAAAVGSPARPASPLGSRDASPAPAPVSLFEPPRAAWADLALLGGIAAAATGGSFGMDVAEY